MSTLLIVAIVLITLALVFYSAGPFDILSPHTLTGQFALWLMFAHATWATKVVRSGTEIARHTFHRFSLIVWVIWLVPYIGGMALAMKP